jgi:hypothetical protein
MSSLEVRRHWQPWARLNLRRNPFGELTSSERLETAIVDVQPLLEFLEQGRTAIQFVGECGRGKTTRLLALRAKLPQSSYVYLGEDQPCPAIPAGSPVMIDEAQRLAKAVQVSVFASGLPLVLATHADLSRPLRRFGYVIQTEQIGIGNDPELVQRLLNRRIEVSRLTDGPIPSVSLEDATKLVQRFGTNIRSIEHHLYDRVQLQVTHHGQMRFVD